MTERQKDLLNLVAILAVMILACSKILFTDRIIRAPDIINEFYWGVKNIAGLSLRELLNVSLTADWSQYINSGHTNNGGMASLQLLIYQRFIFHFIPAPASVAWFIVLHLFFGGAGVYCYCRAIGCGRAGSSLGALIFALAPENASLINAGHVMKIATISFAPWAFYFFEKGFQSRRVIFFLLTGFTLAFQFFNTHWQIAYYTCLGIGFYGVLRTLAILWRERHLSSRREISRLLGMNLVVLLFFLSTVAISLSPLVFWSADTNRGVASGANAGKGGLQAEEAMMWSLPPEELITFVVPGFFGLSRQEGGENPTNISAYYWGRMVFTQTTDYMGLLPWLLLPLPLIFRRDRYTWLALFALAGGIIFSMGKYTFIYQILFDHIPGINRFRAPKMMMFIPVLGLGVLAARGLDCLLDAELRQQRSFRYYLRSLLGLPVLLLVLLGMELAGRNYWISSFFQMFAQPTRFEQGSQLVDQRWQNIVAETWLAALVAALHAGAIWALVRRKIPTQYLLVGLMALYLLDTGRINDKFMFLVKVPEKVKGVRTPLIDYLAGALKSGEYRVLPLDGTDPMELASNRIPVMFTSNPVQQRRWQEFLDIFNFDSAMPDLLNVKYLVVGREQYDRDMRQYGSRYRIVYEVPDGRLVLENSNVLPKAWLVPNVIMLQNPEQALALLQSPGFDPRQLAIVESPPAINLADDASVAGSPGEANLTHYEGNRIEITVNSSRNALLVTGEKYNKWWHTTIDGKTTETYPVNHLLRGVYVPQGKHVVKMQFDPLPFRIGKYLTLASLAIFILFLGREYLHNRNNAQA